MLYFSMLFMFIGKDFIVRSHYKIFAYSRDMEVKNLTSLSLFIVS